VLPVDAYDRLAADLVTAFNSRDEAALAAREPALSAQLAGERLAAADRGRPGGERPACVSRRASRSATIAAG